MCLNILSEINPWHGDALTDKILNYKVEGDPLLSFDERIDL